MPESLRRAGVLLSSKPTLAGFCTPIHRFDEHLLGIPSEYRSRGHDVLLITLRKIHYAEWSFQALLSLAERRHHVV